MCVLPLHLVCRYVARLCGALNYGAKEFRFEKVIKPEVAQSSIPEAPIVNHKRRSWEAWER